MKRHCREIGIARECAKFSDKGIVDKEGHSMGGLFIYYFGLSDLII